MTEKTETFESALKKLEDMVEKLAPHRHAVDRGEMSFLELIAENDLVLDLSRLLPFAHWITPHMMPKRFDTLFYVARAPSGQVAVHDEIVKSGQGAGFGGIGRDDDDTHSDAIGLFPPIHYINTSTNIQL